MPFIACTIGSFVHKGDFQYGKEINDVLLSLPQMRDYTACVDAKDLVGHVGDSLHYNFESQIEIGKRYAGAYEKTWRS